MAQDRRLDFTVGVKADQASFNKLQTQITNLMLSYQKVAAKGGMTEDLKKSMDAAKQLQSILNKSYNSALGSYNMNTFQNELNKAGGSLEKLKANLEASGHGGAATFNNLGSTLLKSNKQITKANKLTTDLFETFKRTAKWGISSSIFHNLTSELSQAVSFAERLDSSLNDIRIVTGASAKDMKEVAAWANQAAKNLSASTTDLSDAALIFYQQGDTGKEAQRKAEITTKVANVTGQDTATAADEMTAVWNGYQAATDEMESYADKMAKVAAATASNFEELSTGMQKVASTGNMMGVSFDQLTAQMSTIISVTREAPETVGTALKTVYARMGDLAVKGQSTDEDGFTTKLGTVTSAMDKMGIQILDAQGNMRDMGTIMEDVGKKWQSWSKAEQTAAATTLAGKRQYTQLTALFDNWDKYVKAKSISESAEGTLNEQQDIYADRLTSAKKTLEATKESIYNDLLNTDAIIPAIKAMTTFADGIDKIVKSLGGGTTAILAFGAVLTKVFSKQIGNEIGRIGRNFTANTSNRSRERLIKNQTDAKTANANKDLEQWRKAKSQMLNTSLSNTAQERAKMKMETSANNYIEGRGSAARYEKELEYTKLLNKYEGLITEEEKEQLKAQMEADAALAEKLEKEKAENKLIKERYKNDDKDKIAGLKGNDKAYDRVMDSYEEKNRANTSLQESALETALAPNSLNVTNDFHSIGEKISQDYFQSIYEAIENFDQDLVNNYKEALDKLQIKIEEDIKTLNGIYHEDKNNYKNVLLSNGEHRERYNTVDNNTLEEYRKDYTKQLKTASEEQKKALQEEIDKINQVLQLRRQINEATERTAETIREVGQAQNQEIRNEQNQYDQDVERYQTNQGNIESDIHTNNANDKSLKDFDKSLQKWKNVGDSIDVVTNSAAGLISVWSGFSSIADIWNDDELSSWEKFGEILTTLAFVGPTALSSIKGLSQGLGGLIQSTTEFKDISVEAGTGLIGTFKAAATAESSVAGGLAKILPALASILVPILAVGAAIGTIALLINQISEGEALEKQATATGQAEAAYTAASNAASVYGEVVDNLKSKHDALNESIQKLADAKDAFKGLEKGTEEWNEAILNQNQVVLDLINKYKDLAQYVTIDENGAMSIDNDHLLAVQADQVKQQQEAIESQVIAQGQEQKTNADQTYEQSLDKIAKEAKNSGSQIYDKEKLRSIVQSLNDQGKNLSESNVSDELEKSGIKFKGSLEDFCSILQKVNQAELEHQTNLEAANKVEKAGYKSKLQNNSDYKQSEYKDALTTLGSNNYNALLESKTALLKSQDKENITGQNWFQTTTGLFRAEDGVSKEEALKNKKEHIAAQLSSMYGKEYEASDIEMDSWNSNNFTISGKKGQEYEGTTDVQKILDAYYQTEAKKQVDQSDDKSIEAFADKLDNLGDKIVSDSGLSKDEITSALNSFIGSGGSTEGLSQRVLDEFATINWESVFPGAKQLGLDFSSFSENAKTQSNILKDLSNKMKTDEYSGTAKDKLENNLNQTEKENYANNLEKSQTAFQAFQGRSTNSDVINDKSGDSNVGNTLQSFIKDNEQYADKIGKAWGQIDFSSSISYIDQFKEALNAEGVKYTDLIDKNGNFITSLDYLKQQMIETGQAAAMSADDYLSLETKISSVNKVGDTIDLGTYDSLKNYFSDKDLKSMFAQTYDKSGNIVYSVNITPEALQEAFNKASNIEYNSNADDDAQRAYASTKDQASDLLSSGIKDKNINDQIQVIQNNMIGKGATTRAELDKKENKIEAETNKHLKEQYGITVKNTKARENELKLKKNLSTIEQKELANLQKYNKAKKESEKRSKAYATVVAQEEQALTELGKNWNKYNKAFKAGDKGSDDYKSGVQAVQKAFQTNFGNEDMQIQDFIDDDFIEKHRESIDKMLNGDKEAYQKLRKDIAKEYIKGIKLNIDKDSFNGSLKDARQKLQDWAAKIPRPKLGVDLDEKYVQQLNKMIKQFGLSTDQAQAMLNELGYDPEITTKKVKVPVVDNELSSKNSTSVPDAAIQAAKKQGNTNIFSGKIKYETVEIPVIKTAHSKSNNGSGKDYVTNTSSSKGSGSSKKPEQASPIKNTYDAYEKWEELIERINTKLSILQKKQEHLTGKELVKNLEKQAALLVKIRSLREKERQEADKQLDKTNRKVKRFTSGKLSKKYNNLGLKRKDYIGVDDEGNETFDDEQYLEDFANAYEKKWRDSKTGKWKELKTKSQKQANKKDKQSYDYIKKILDERDNALKKQNEQDEAYQEAFNQTVSKYIEIHDAGTQIIEDAKEIRDTFNQLNLDKLETQLTRLQNGLTRLQNKANQLAGAEKIENYNQQNENLREQIKNSQDKEKDRRKQAKDDAKDMQKVIDNSVNNVGASKYTKKQLKDVKVETDESGLITNSEEIANKYNKTLKGLDPKIKAKEAEIKSLRKQKKNAKTAKKKNEIQRKIEKAQTELAMMKGDKTNLKSDLSTIQSDSTSNSDNVKEAEAEVANQDSYQQQISENLFAKFEYSWTIKVDDAEAKQKIKQLGIDLTKALSTDADGGELQSLFSNIAAQKEVNKVYLDEAESYRAKIQEILDAQARGEEIDDNQLQSYIDKLNEISENIESSISTNINNITALYSSIDTTVKANLEIYQDLSNWLSASDNMSEAFNTILSTFKENGSLRGWQNGNLQNKITNASTLSALKMNELTAQTNLYKTTKAEYDSFLAKEAKGEALTEQEQSAKKADKLTLNSTKEVIQQDVNEVITQALNIYQNKLTLLTNKINDNVEEAFKTINGQFLKDAQAIFNWLQNTSKRYYDRTERPFQISSYGTYADKLMSNTNNIEYQERLKKVYNEQLRILREKDKLSQYDVDRAKKLLDLEIKRQALEDARNNKTNLKLRRDQSGNYSYQYIADPSKVADAQANLEQAKNDVYELDKTNLATSLNNYFSDSQAMQEELKNAYKNAAKDKEGNIIDQASFDEEIKNIKEKYQDVVVSNAQDVLTRFNNFKQSSGLNWSNMSEAQQNSALRAAGFDPDIIKSALQNNSIEKWNNFFNSNFGSGSEYYKNNQDLITSTQEINKQLTNVNTYLKAIVGDVTQEDKTQSDKNNQNLSTIIDETKTEIGNLVNETKRLIVAYKENKKTQTDAQGDGKDDDTTYTRSSINEAKVGIRTPSAKDIINNLDKTPTETETFDVAKGKYIKKGTKVYDGMNNLIFTAGKDTSIKHIGNVKGTLGPHQKIKIKSGEYKGQIGFVKKNQIVGLKSGGYTGDWSDTSIDKDNGKLAWLHQKELVLNANDTENMLNAVGLVRDISSLLYNMNTSAFSRATDLMSNLYQRFGSAVGGNSNVIQNINIDADFPGVKDAIQIERAFKNLSNIALQKSSNSTTISNATSTL